MYYNVSSTHVKKAKDMKRHERTWKKIRKWKETRGDETKWSKIKGNERKGKGNERKWKEMKGNQRKPKEMAHGGGSTKPIFGSFWLSFCYRFCYRSGYRSRQGVWLGNLFEDIWSIFNANSGSFDHLRLFACWAGFVWLAGWITKTNWKGTPCGPSPLTKITVFI